MQLITHNHHMSCLDCEHSKLVSDETTAIETKTRLLMDLRHWETILGASVHLNKQAARRRR